MKVIYPTNGIWDGSNQLINNDEPVPTGFTAVQPVQPAYALEFRGDQWVETATQDEIVHWAETHGNPDFKSEQEPTAEQLSITELAQQSADNEQHIKSVEEAITAFAQANGGK